MKWLYVQKQLYIKNFNMDVRKGIEIIISC